MTSVPKDDQYYAPSGYSYILSITTKELFKMPSGHCQCAAKAASTVVPSFAVAVVYSSASFGRRSTLLEKLCHGSSLLITTRFVQDPSRNSQSVNTLFQSD